LVFLTQRRKGAKFFFDNVWPRRRKGAKFFLLSKVLEVSCVMNLHSEVDECFSA
jgi:hypothetical protein